VCGLPQEEAWPEMTIRDRIQQIGVQMLAGDPSPAEVRDHEIQLAGLLAATNKALISAELAYKRHLAHVRVECKSAADAKLQAEGSDQYADLLEAKSARDSVMEMLRTCRSYGRSKSEEMRLER
jgi:hypothetical protein